MRTHHVGDPFPPKQKYSSICEQEDLLQQFQDELSNDEEVFFSSRFFDNDDGDNDAEFSSVSDNDNGKISNVTVADALEPELVPML